MPSKKQILQIVGIIVAYNLASRFLLKKIPVIGDYL